MQQRPWKVRELYGDRTTMGCTLQGRTLTSQFMPSFFAPEFQVVFICGLFKTGSSLLTKILSESGYLDPSRLSNPQERGYSTSGGRYLTRECSLVRKINERLLHRAAQEPARDDYGTSSSRPLNLSRPIDYLDLWSFPVVLKDPQFVYTLQPWLKAAKQLGLSTAVYFTYRRQEELTAAWMEAPFTRKLSS